MIFALSLVFLCLLREKEEREREYFWSCVLGLFRFENGDDDDENVVVVIIFIFFVLLKAVVGRLKRREREKARAHEGGGGDSREREIFPHKQGEEGEEKSYLFFERPQSLGF